MIFLELFFTFFLIGLFTFGGGYAMLPLIREQVIAKGWLTETDLITYIAIAESTPGPIAINLSTFVGYSQGGVLGVLAALLGVVLPSFIIILLIAVILKRMMEQRDVKAALKALAPCVVGLISATGLIFILGTLFPNSLALKSFDLKALLTLIAIAGCYLLISYIRKKKMPPIFIIGLGVLFGLIFYL